MFTTVMVLTMLVNSELVIGSTPFCIKSDCKPNKLALLSACFNFCRQLKKNASQGGGVRIFPTVVLNSMTNRIGWQKPTTKRRGWLACDICFGFQSNPDPFIRKNCALGCIYNGARPPFNKKPTPPSTRSTTSQQKQTPTTFKIWLTSTQTNKRDYTTVSVANIRTQFEANELGDGDRIVGRIKYDTKNNTKDANAFIWLLLGIFGGFIFLVGFFTFSTKLLARVTNTQRNNKIGPTDVIIHRPTNRNNNLDIYVIT